MNSYSGGWESPSVRHSFILYASLVFLVYFNSLGGEFVFDDRPYVIENYLIKNFDLQNLYALFTSVYGWDYLPLTLLSLNLDYMIWGLNPFGYHLTNLLLHLMSGLILHRIVCHLVRSQRIAFWTAFLFLLHPVHVESVAWISERKNVLSMVFLLLAFYRYRIAGSGWGSIALFLLACLAKTTAVTFPLLLILNDICFSKKTAVRMLSDKVPYFLISLAVSVVAIIVNTEAGIVREHQDGNMIFTAVSMMVVFKEYLIKFLVPINLNIWYANPLVASLSFGELVRAFLIDGLYLGFLIWSWRRNKTVFFGLLWFAITLLPVSHIVPIPQMMADRFLYLPSIGGSLALICFLETYAKTMQGRWRLFQGLAGVAVVSGFLILVMNRVPVFHHELALWQDSVRRDDSNTIAMMHLGLAYREQGELDTALEKLAQARKIDPKNFKAGLYRAMILEEKKDFESAEKEYADLIREYPDKAETYTHLAVLQGGQDRVLPALGNLNHAIDLDPGFALARYNRGIFLDRIGETRQALTDFQQAVEHDPENAFFHYQLGRFYLAKTDRSDLGRLHLAKSLRLDPDQAAADEIRQRLFR